VFAYLGRPKGIVGPAPGIVLVHGGAGKAFAEWAAQWAAYGYVALAMDLNGRDDQGRHLVDGGPIMGEGTLITDVAKGSIRDMWPYQATAAATRAVTLLSNDPAVKSDRVGIMGISWGSYVAGIVAGLDHRLAFAILAYGCGFFYEDSIYRMPLASMPEISRAAWIGNFDQSRYLAGLEAPVFWLTDTTDHFFPLDSWTRSQGMTRAKSTTLRVLPNWRHGYAPVWQTRECRMFADQVTGGSEPVTRAAVEFTDGAGDWEKRSWREQPAILDSAAHRVTAQLPPGTTAAFVNLTDDRGAVTSGPCWMADSPPGSPPRAALPQAGR
jgi:dienelactone hydrolase